MCADNRLHQVGVAFLTSLFGDGQIARPDPNRFVKSFCGEVKRVPETIGRFGRVFADQTGWRMAVVASGDGAVR